MNTKEKIAVCSRSFSKNPVLRKELLAKYSQVTFNDLGLELHGEELVSFLQGHDKAITALEIIDSNVISKLPTLKLISKYGVGLDMIDISAMRTYGKDLSWTSGVNRRSVSELVVAFAISLLRHVHIAQKEAISGVWRQHVGNCLTGKTVGIIGCGNIGQDLVILLKPFNCEILVYDIQNYSEFYTQHGVTPIDLESLLKKSDIVTLHVPFNKSTSGLLSADALAMVKSTAILINTARGGIVDEVTLKIMLREKKIAGAAFDVFATEPPQDHELLELDNFVVTPHIGGSAQEAILAMGRAAIDGLSKSNFDWSSVD